MNLEQAIIANARSLYAVELANGTIDLKEAVDLSLIVWPATEYEVVKPETT
jgi:hypothetical protein